MRHLKSLPDGKKIAYLKSGAKTLLGLHGLVRVTKNKNYFYQVKSKITLPYAGIPIDETRGWFTLIM